MVFVGGAVVSLYTDDPSANEIRPTADVDLTIDLLNYADWVQMQERLADLGFNPNPGGKSICSHLYNNIAIDIMPAEDSSIGPSNSWYKFGFNNLWQLDARGQKITVFAAPYYLATKFEAYNNRGTDYRTSHDFEDIINILDNRTTIVEEILNSDEKVRTFLRSEFKKIMDSPFSDEIVSCHIHPLIREERIPIIEDKIFKILN